MHDPAIARLRDTATQVASTLRTHERALAEATERRLFPDGVPPGPITIAMLMRAVVAAINRSAQAMAEADARYNAALRKHKPEQAPAALISQDVAERLAVTAELEARVEASADETGALLESQLFPHGRPHDLTVLAFIMTLRERIDVIVALAEDDIDPLSEDECAELFDLLTPTAQFCAGLAAVSGLAELSQELEDLITQPKDAN
ncbi:hypothetical protein [Haliangium sp.]|uniref:hypothetical protein n=1 Tax=Haliangium sp. TaxID=2663208 RepID=UPI003D0AD141